MLNEVWKPVKGYEGFYEVSNLGRVKSLERIDRFNKKWKCRILKPNYVGKHYQTIGLCKNGKVSRKKVHRLVAETFVPNPYNKPQVNHIDGDKENNFANNLEWVTNAENQLHAREKGLNPITKNNLLYSIQVDMFTKNGDFIKTFPSICEAERQLGIHNGNIASCCKRDFWKYSAGGFRWAYHKERK